MIGLLDNILTFKFDNRSIRINNNQGWALTS